MFSQVQVYAPQHGGDMDIGEAQYCFPILASGSLDSPKMCDIDVRFINFCYAGKHLV